MNSLFELIHLRAYLAITGTLIFFYLYYYSSCSSLLQKSVYLNSPGSKKELCLFSPWKFSGFIFLGILPFLIYTVFLDVSFSWYGFTFYHCSVVAINITIYSAIHLVNGVGRAIGALLFGSGACYFTSC